MTLSLVLGSVLVAYAAHDGDPDIADIVISFPATYASCVDAETSDDTSITNVGTRYLQGQIIVQYQLDGGVRQIIETISVAGAGNFAATVTYPPVSEWPVQSNGTREIHVDIQIEVYSSQGGDLIGTLGPEHDWDVFCLSDVSTPTPTPVPPTPTPVPPTPTPTATIPLGFQGCTPGYWKQPQHLDSWVSYLTGDLFATVFGVDDSNDLTLLQALQARGGGESALQRHAVAALLNSVSPDVAGTYTSAEVIAMVQQAYASGNFESIKNLFETANELGCPLN